MVSFCVIYLWHIDDKSQITIVQAAALMVDNCTAGIETMMVDK